MFPSGFSLEDDSTEARLLRKARDEYRVILKPIEVQRRTSQDPATWAESYTKLLAFNQTEYKRVLHLDSDSTVLQSMDELFLIEPAWIAMPRAYWLGFEGRVLSSQLLLLQPSGYEFDRVMKATTNAGDNDYDMDILNKLYQDSAMILPHKNYDLLTGEFRGDDHQKYLQDNQQGWDPDLVLKEAKYMHFSDWPLPKPWLAKPKAVDRSKPHCSPISTVNKTEDCRNQEIWVGAYTDFRRRRKDICDLDV
ncbi:MAG: N-acetylglucosaminyltransferase [Alectoria fallacina]|uniref:N-acetylglucosaminyltransferase n=1 Tax=Alectoria fallacina TaxID=1903189 RepID=A0A8H3F3U0_9LECA|nr:MAG: N-acetylglucosaminyltransferase [Alectoria fallacina]